MIYLKSLNSESGGMKDMEKSITLIGLPGCGKTTVGNLLSDKLKYEFVDMDFYIENKQQKSIIELFRNGEDYFRNIETETCKVLGEKSKTIISSGGGVIKKSINIEYLKKNSIVVFIDRPVENILGDIQVEKRPLLANGKEVLYKLYDERYDLYKKFCDYRVENTGSLDEIVDKIAKLRNS
jgi:shikimate kinase